MVILSRLLVGLLIASPLFSYSQAVQPPAQQAQEKIDWMSWDEAMAQMEKDSVKKKVFIDVYTNWCGWCKKMDKSTFMDRAVVTEMNTKYYPVKLNAEMTEDITYNNHTFKNKNPGGRRSVHELAGSLLDWQMSYPSYVILDEKQTRITMFKGYKQIPDMFAILNFFGKQQYLHHNQFLLNTWNAQQKQREQQLQQANQLKVQEKPKQ